MKLGDVPCWANGRIVELEVLTSIEKFSFFHWFGLIGMVEEKNNVTFWPYAVYQGALQPKTLLKGK